MGLEGRLLLPDGDGSSPSVWSHSHAASSPPLSPFTRHSQVKADVLLRKKEECPHLLPPLALLYTPYFFPFSQQQRGRRCRHSLEKCCSSRRRRRRSASSSQNQKSPLPPQSLIHYIHSKSTTVFPLFLYVSNPDRKRKLRRIRSFVPSGY